MGNTTDTILTGLFAFAGGFLAGILLAPDSGARTRGRIADEARGQIKKLEGKLEFLENEMAGLRNSVKTAGAGVGDKVKDAAHQAVDQVVPNVPKDPDAFKVESDAVSRDLKHMPRK